MGNKLTKREIPYSKKDIPIPLRKEYYKKLISKIESLCRRMGWHAYFVLYPEEEEKEKKNFYGFKSGRAPPPEGQAVIKPFLNKLLDMATNLKFRRSFGNDFQSRLKADLQ